MAETGWWWVLEFIVDTTTQLILKIVPEPTMTKRAPYRGDNNFAHLRGTDGQTDRRTCRLVWYYWDGYKGGNCGDKRECTINNLTKFHKDWMKTVPSSVYTSDLINILTKFHKDWMKTINILTKFHKDWMKTYSMMIPETLEYVNIIGTNIVTKILEDRKINVTSRVLTMKNAPPPGGMFLNQL
ncbi:hypothetical protein DPMN_084619 [Dreissena polymorpha]|uniref:Uncharacterized protein n=1 Tax=Dreissena polymorpha TaxID=45954 RepID=A0A9D4BJF0_DREPO|nr:hypothetical protein DPMN_084619 [Dreissena polymorpha]